MDAINDKFSGFDEIITSIDEVTDVIGEPTEVVLAAVTDHLDDICRAYIATSPFCFIATANPDGYLDVSPKGDPAGFVQVLDDKHVAIPDRPGNRRADTLHNLLKDPRVGLIFIIPGKRETLRISGEARIVRDQKLRDSMAVNGKAPAFAIVVHVDRVFSHCPKCMVRSKLWEPDAWPDLAGTASHAAAVIKHGNLPLTEDELRAEVEKAGITELY